tara:strand:+ start:1236 stop:1802 length:567 start_codon:yes stop_codon:yes gene_type:complete
MSIFGDIFRRRSRTNHPDGSRSVVVTDRHGNVRKTKHKGPGGTYKQRYDRDGNLWKAKQKGRGVKRLKQRFVRQMDPRIEAHMIDQQRQMDMRMAEAERLRQMQMAYELQMLQMQNQMFLNNLSGINMPGPYVSPNSGLTMNPYGAAGGPQTQMRRGGSRKRYMGGGSKKRMYKKGGGSKSRGPHGIL